MQPSALAPPRAAVRPGGGRACAPVPRRAGAGPTLPSQARRAGTLAPRPPAAADTAAAAAPAPQRLGLIQHKSEARLFYRFLSIVYDKIVNPGHWTVDMRTAALAPADLKPTHRVVDVGGGTGFCTQGVVAAGVPPSNITLLDQSPHQLAKARAKPDLAGVTIVEGDAEDLPFPTDTFDRYTSAGSIEYWPEPERGIAEAYRVLKPGGVACVIGPVAPTNPVSLFFQRAWMLFPRESDYELWMRAAGFEDVRLTRIGPPWYRGVRRHGLIMGCSYTGVKPKAGASPAVLGPKKEVSPATAKNARTSLSTIARVVLGSLAGFYYFLLPIYFWIKNLVWPKGLGGF